MSTTAGDSFAAAFGRASNAVRAATEAQLALDGATWPGPSLRVRMGLHLGEAEERDGDHFGPVVNTAARVEAAGHGGQVLITDSVRAAAAPTDVTDLGVSADSNEPLGVAPTVTQHFIGTNGPNGEARRAGSSEGCDGRRMFLPAGGSGWG